MKDNNATIYPDLDRNKRQKTQNNDNKRCHTEINASILDLCSGCGIIKTHIMYKANLSYAMLTSYINKLLECGLLETTADDSRELFRITEKGRQYLYHYFLMQKLVELPVGGSIATLESCS